MYVEFFDLQEKDSKVAFLQKAIDFICKYKITFILVVTISLIFNKTFKNKNYICHQ